MAFIITSNINFDGYQPVRPNEFHWKRSVDNFTDSCTIKLPNLARVNNKGIITSFVQTATQFQQGQKVSCYGGYYDLNDTRLDEEGNPLYGNDLLFKGFISRINFTLPVEIECEGYSYQLRKKLGINKSYQSTTVKNILTDLIQGTDIKLHPSIPNIPIQKATFINASGIQVLEWLKEKCLLSVQFIFDTLYVGGLQLSSIDSVNFQLGWNTVKDNELKFNQTEFAQVQITILSPSAQGTKTKVKQPINGKVSGTLSLKSLINDPSTMQAIASQKQKEKIAMGYEGVIMAFLKPHVEPSMATVITDPIYTARKGKYFVSGVDGSITKSGGRQKVKIGYSLS